MRLKLFGDFEARGPGGQAIAFRRKRAEALLAFLALQPAQAHAREELAALLWADADGERARHSLRQVLVSLRQGLAAARPPVLLEDGDSVAIDPNAIEVDVLAFERLVAAGTPRSLADAVDLYRGELLAGLGTEDTAFDAWLLTRREHVREKAIQALARLLEHQRAQSKHDEAIATAMRLIAMDRTQEAVHRSLMRLYAQRGRRGAALRQYQACLTALEQELGVPPEDETRLLYRDLLRANATQTSGGAAQPLLGRAALAQPAASGMPIIGRDEERSQLSALRMHAAQGRGASVVILGEGGIGKSRLVEALVEDAERAGVLVLLGRAWEAERNLPFGPWVHAFRAAGVVPDLAAGLDTRSQRELARLFPDLGAPPSDETAQDHLRLFEAMSKALQRLCLQGPLVVIIEDLHWADEMSIRLLAYLTRAMAGSPVLLATTARPGEVRSAPLVERTLSEIGRQPRSRQIALAPISRADTLAFVGTLMRVGTGESMIRSLGEMAWRIGKGNPFMVIETVRAARDTGTTDLADAPQAADVVTARLARLTGIAAQLAAVAAVIGREFDFALLARAADLTPAEAAEGISELVERRLLHAVGEHLDFAHDHIRDAAYARLAGLHRRMLHGAVARVLEEIHAGDLVSQYSALGRHCFESERWERAFHYLRAAGVDAAARSAHREAVASFEQALAAAAQLPQDAEHVRTAIDISFALRGSLTLLGDLKGTLDCLRSAEPAARTLGDPDLQVWVSIFTGNCLTLMGRHAEALEAGEQVRAIAAQGKVAGLEFYWPAIVLGASRFFMGDFRQAEKLLRPAAAAAADDTAYRKRGVIGNPAVVSHTFLALSLAETGDFDDALAHAMSALSLSERLDSPWDTGHACMAVGIVHLRRGETSRGVPVLKRAVELTRVRDLPMGTRILTPILGAALARDGEIAAALEILAPVAAAPLLPYCLNFVGEAYLLAGHADEAAGIAARALEHSTQRKEHSTRAWAFWLQGCIASCRAPPDAPTGLEHYRRAVALAEERDMRPLAAHCYLGMGELLAATGHQRHARDALVQAGQLYEKMAMTYWTKRAQTAQASVS
ncbi:MAG: AAA family ATPase [Betaproteobacteria bacterium]|nr:AAA family ATPase [Betaproteobacteria bacterium]